MFWIENIHTFAKIFDLSRSDYIVVKKNQNFSGQVYLFLHVKRCLLIF